MQQGGKDRRYSFAAHLVAFALLVALPIILLAGVLLAHSAHLARTQAEARLVQLATDLTEDIDRDIERHILVLNTLATLPSFRARDWATFHGQARDALRGDGYIVVTDRALRQMANTYVPFGQQPARTGDLETGQRILTSREMAVSDVFHSLVTDGSVVNFDMPILRNGEVAYILIYARPVEHVQTIVAGQSLEPGWVGAVFDRKGVLVASAGRADEDAPAPTVGPGLSRWRDREGQAMLRAAHRSAVSGWTIVVDVPLAVVSGEVNRSLLWWLLFALAAIALAIGLGVMFGRFLSSQIRRAAAYAAAVGRAEAEPRLPGTTLNEIRAMTNALETAGAEIKRRMRQQELLSRELNHRVKNVLSVVQAVVKRTFADPRPPEQSYAILTQRLQALARSQDLLTRTEWSAQPLRQIVDMELAHFGDRVRREGPDVQVKASAVQNFALVLHELLTNAVKYGALRDEHGAIDLRWGGEGSGAARRFKFSWKERCEPSAAGIDKKGFGSTLLKSAFASTRLEVEPDGLNYECEAEWDSIVEGEAIAEDSAAPVAASSGSP